MLEFYHNIPQLMAPTVFTVGVFSLYWYAVMYMLGIGVSGVILWKLIRHEISFDDYIDLLFALVMGVLIGARLGYVIMYALPYYLSHPFAIVSPFDAVTGEWIGIAGMSYYGGCIGAMLGLWLWKRGYDAKTNMKRLTFLWITDMLSLALPFGYFFGRLGNFLNGELYGRVTNQFFGMYFSSAPSGLLFLRHPSQIYEAFSEGLLLGYVLWYVKKNRSYADGTITALYIGGYAAIRFIVEFFREPDVQLGYVWTYMTVGQLLSGVFLLCTCLFMSMRKRYPR